ncbi:MAG TPA: hypothetical protein VD908_15720 [Cytophagales bacterium]|nr:hypothetical protein [Cytophagales bacterium]
MVDPIKVMKYSDEILAVFNDREEIDDSDFQAAIEAVVMNIIADVQSGN